MSLLDFFTGAATDPDMDRKVASILSGIGRYEIGTRVADGLWEGEDEKLGRENQRLDIAMKRRTLGLQDSDDFDDARNTERTLYAMTGRGVLQAIPEPGYMSQKVADSFTLKPRPSSFLGELGHVGNTSRGGRVGSSILRLFTRR